MKHEKVVSEVQEGYFQLVSAMLHNVDINTIFYVEQFEILHELLEDVKKIMKEQDVRLYTHDKFSHDLISCLSEFFRIYLVEFDIPENNKKLSVVRRLRAYSQSQFLKTHLISLFRKLTTSLLTVDKFQNNKALVKKIRDLTEEFSTFYEEDMHTAFTKDLLRYHYLYPESDLSQYIGKQPQVFADLMILPKSSDKFYEHQNSYMRNYSGYIFEERWFELLSDSLPSQQIKVDLRKPLITGIFSQTMFPALFKTGDKVKPATIFITRTTDASRLPSTVRGEFAYKLQTAIKEKNFLQNDFRDSLFSAKENSDHLLHLYGFGSISEKGNFLIVESVFCSLQEVMVLPEVENPESFFKTLIDENKNFRNLGFEEALCCFYELALGLSHLHESFQIHGFLTSASVFIVAKQTSSGLKKTIKLNEHTLKLGLNNHEGFNTRNLLHELPWWKIATVPPDIVQATINTQASDIYSYAMLFYNALSSCFPYSDVLKAIEKKVTPTLRKRKEYMFKAPQVIRNEMLLRHIMKGNKPNMNFLNKGKSETHGKKVVGLIESCLNKEPHERAYTTETVEWLDEILTDLKINKAQVMSRIGENF
eukprot:augustus_masked-scaffold_7-processed-gene-10.5-mRNA-1 protein AED:1.00 eAED:1.00 QI:0/-1/0/0/-1/1/1/0/591